jgi:small nuclear ribonucleoprotein (snRNP)-like protein
MKMDVNIADVVLNFLNSQGVDTSTKDYTELYNLLTKFDEHERVILKENKHLKKENKSLKTKVRNAELYIDTIRIINSLRG